MIKTMLLAAIKAAKKIQEIYLSNDFEIRLKSDNSPLTEADQLSHEIIINELKQTGLPILSEEGKKISFSERKSWDTFWLIDPLDGTKEFIKRNGEFTVNIALMKNKIPIEGVILAPDLPEIFFTMNGKSFTSKITTLNENDEIILEKIFENKTELPLKFENKKFIVAGSRSHMNQETENFVNKLKLKHPDLEMINKGSSLKICKVAEGVVDVYPRFGPTMEWDTAAGHAIAKQAGCKVINTETDKELNYNKESLLNPYFIVYRD